MPAGKRLTDLPEKVTEIIGTDILLVTDAADGLSKQVAASQLPEIGTATWLAPVRAATTEPIVLSQVAPESVIDGVELAAGERLLVKDQEGEDRVEHGVYAVQAEGPPARVAGLTTGAEAAGVAVMVTEGDENADTAWICTSDAGSDVVGTDELEWGPFPGTGGDCCEALGDYEPDNYAVGEQTPVAQLAGIDAALGDLGSGAVQAQGALTAATGDQVGYAYDLEVNKAAGSYTALAVNVTETAAPGADNKLIDLQVGGVSQLSVADDGAATIHNPGTAAGPALEVDYGSGGPLGVYAPAANQVAVAANEKAVVLDGGSESAFTPLTSALLRLGSATLPWLALHASRLVSAVLADPTDETKLVAVNVANVTTGNTRTLTVPDHDYTLNTLRESSGPTALTMGAVADGEMLVRSGTTIVGAEVPSGGSSSPTAPTTIATQTATISDSAQSPGVHNRTFRLTYDAGSITVTFGEAAAGSRCVLHVESAVDVGFGVSGVTFTTRVGLIDAISEGPASVYVEWLTTTTIHLSGELDVA